MFMEMGKFNMESSRDDASENLVVKSFRVKGLHGFKNVEIEFESNARIVIAENGSGKTTVLSALAYFLRGEFLSLKSLPLDEVECDFYDGTSLKTIRIKNDDIRLDRYDDSSVDELVRYSSLNEAQILSMLSEGKGEIPEHFIDEIYYGSPYGRDEIQGFIDSIREKIEDSLGEELKESKEIIRRVMAGLEILHLPTYRRVERPMQNMRKSRLRGRNMRFLQSNQEKIYKKNEAVGNNISYGLSDVEARLQDMAAEIQRKSDRGYRQISAAIIEDLVRSKNIDTPRESLPELESLRLFLSRVDQAELSVYGSSGLEKLYSDDEGVSRGTQSQILRYFLAKLAVVVNETKELESQIEKFVEKVNGYLEVSSDEKKLSYDSVKMMVEIKNNWTGNTVKMDDLSSGEKQVVSLFSYLYLYNRKYIILIDEPELSLSIDWQRKLLPDVLASTSCEQLLAITHSPFIFENNLDNVAGPMRIDRYKD